MFTIEKVSLSLPADLFEAVSRTAQGNNRSRSQEVSELIRTGLTARKQIDLLYREIAQLKERLATAEARPKPPPPDARDFLTGWSPGTSKLRDELRWAEENRRQQETDAAEARRECRAWKAKAAELRASNASQRTELTAIQDRVAAAEQAQAEAEAVLAAELARKLPWHFHVPIPIFDVTVIPKHYIKPDPPSWRRGFAAASLVAGLILFLMPHEGSKLITATNLAVLFTRAREEVSLVTDDLDRLTGRAAWQSGEKTSAIEIAVSVAPEVEVRLQGPEPKVPERERSIENDRSRGDIDRGAGSRDRERDMDYGR